MPLDSENLDNIIGADEAKAVSEFFYLTERLIELLRLASRSRELAYVETEYHGGTGGQGAALFRRGEIVGGPDWRKTDAINDVLLRMDVALRAHKLDAFDVIGLDKRAWPGSWRRGDWS